MGGMLLLTWWDQLAKDLRVQSLGVKTVLKRVTPLKSQSSSTGEPVRVDRFEPLILCANRSRRICQPTSVPRGPFCHESGAAHSGVHHTTSYVAIDAWELLANALLIQEIDVGATSPIKLNLTKSTDFRDKFS